MRKIRSLTILLIALLTLCMPAHGHEVPDPDRQGSISITMHMGQETVSGGTLLLYRVGDVAEEDGNYFFVPADDYKASGLSYEEPNGELAGKLEDWIREYELPALKTAQIGEDGKAAFYELEVGLYLLVQGEAAPGYSRAEPFLVSIPMNENGSYRYEVDASPKVELEREPSQPTEPTQPGEPSLPQTGQLNWPIPVLTVAGLAVFTLGWALRFGKGKEGYEA